jgi:hypothetical protein
MRFWPLFLTLNIAILVLNCLKLHHSYNLSKEQINGTEVAFKSQEHKFNSISNKNNRFSVFPSDFADSRKIALIIAIGAYNEQKTGWQTINTLNDVPLIYSALKHQGFIDNNITIIKNEACTKEGIVSAIRSKLIDKAKPGDIIFLHYCGHGQRIFDDNGDEIDGYDEALIPIDAPKKYTNAYKGEKHLRDDELGKLITQIRKKVGTSGEVILTIDACHSGSITRGDTPLSLVRGTNLLFEPEGYSPKLRSGEKEVSGYVETNHSFTGNSELAPFIVFSASSYDELNSETFDDNKKPVGALSYAFSKSFASIAPESTYRNLFEQIKVIMSAKVPRQTPQLEGDVDRKILRGGAVKQTFYVKMNKYINDRQITVGAGNLFGFYKDSKVGLYPSNTQDPINVSPLARGRVVEALEVESRIEFDRPISKMEAQNGWVFITEQNLGELAVKVNLLIDDTKHQQKLQKLITSTPIIQLTKESPDLTIRYNKRKDTLYIISSNNQRLFSKYLPISILETSYEEIIKKIKSYARANYLRKMDLKCSDYDVRLEIVPVRIAGTELTEKLNPNAKRAPGGQIVFYNDEPFILRINNQGKMPAFYSVLDIDTDDNLNVLIPYPGTTPTEFKIEPGKTLDLPIIYRFSEPFGNEIFKVIATKYPIDLCTVINTPGMVKRGEANPLEILISDSFQGTRAQPVSVPKGSVNISTNIILVKQQN